MRNISSKRAKALSISAAVKARVWERDNHLCVYCHSPNAIPEAHYISRAKGGLGVEENILTLCRRCHDRYDHGTREEKRELARRFKEYLNKQYENWNEDELIYRRSKC